MASSGIVEGVERAVPKAARTARVSYQFGLSGDIVITTASGLSRTIRATRERAYPGLAGPAPQTEGIYEALAPIVRGGNVVDIGCGIGLGALILEEHADRITAIDSSPLVIELAKDVSPAANIALLDGAEVHSLGSFTHALLVDTLAHVTSPLSVLRGVRQALGQGGVALFAEPAASISQTLQPPLRRAFSKTLVRALLATAGLSLTRFISDGFPFLLWEATPTPDDGWRWLQHGIAVGYEHPSEALSALARAASSVDPGTQVEAALAEADLRKRLRQGDAACAAYIRAKELAPTDGRPLAGLAVAMFDKGDTETALELTKMAIALDPLDLVSRLTFAAIMDQLAPMRAASCWRVVNALAPDNQQWAVNFALAVKGGRFGRDALFALNRLEQYPDPLSAAVLAAKAEVLSSLGRTAEAALATRTAEAT